MKHPNPFLLFVVFVLTAGLAFTQPAPAAARTEKPFKSLGLTEDQVTQVTGAVEKARSAAKVQKAAVGVLDAQIRQAMVAPSPDLKAVNALVDQKTLLLAALEKQKFAGDVQVRQIVGDKVFDQARKLFHKPAKAAKKAKAAKVKPRQRP